MRSASLERTCAEQQRSNGRGGGENVDQQDVSGDDQGRKSKKLESADKGSPVPLMITAVDESQQNDFA